jgi:hypothetical protein
LRDLAGSSLFSSEENERAASEMRVTYAKDKHTAINDGILVV